MNKKNKSNYFFENDFNKQSKREIKDTLIDMKNFVKSEIPKLKKSGVSFFSLKQSSKKIAKKYKKQITKNNFMQIKEHIKHDCFEEVQKKYKDETEDQPFLVRVIAEVLNTLVLILIILYLFF